jgi:hypothetical protein
VIGNKKGAFVFTNEARKVSRAEWAKAQPEVLFPDATRNTLTARDVIVHTPRASDVAKGKAKGKAPAVESPVPVGNGSPPSGAKGGRGDNQPQRTP